MADLDYVYLIGRLGLVVGDGADTDENPDTDWCDEGTVTLTPLITYTKVVGASPTAWTGGNAVISTTVNGDGAVTRNGVPRVKLVDLTSDTVNPKISSGRATHTVEFFNVKARDTRVAFAKQDIRIAADTTQALSAEAATFYGLPAGTMVCDLTKLMPVPTGSGTPIVVGPRGTGIEALTVDGTDLVYELSDGTTENAGTLPVGPGGTPEGIALAINDTAGPAGAAVAAKQLAGVTNPGPVRDGVDARVLAVSPGSAPATVKKVGTVALIDEPPSVSGDPLIDGYKRPAASTYEAKRIWQPSFNTEIDYALLNFSLGWASDNDVLVTLTADTTTGSTPLTNITGVTGSILGSHLQGLMVVGAGIPAGTIVSSSGASSVGMSQQATATATAVTLQLCRPSYRPAPAVALGTLTATSGQTTVTGAGFTALSAAGSIYRGQLLTGTRIGTGSTIVSIDSDTQLTLSLPATSTGTTSISAGGEPQTVTIMTKETLKDVEIYGKYFPKSSGSPASSLLRFVGKYLTDNNHWRVTKKYGGAATTQGESLWKGLVATTDALSNTIAFMLPRGFRVRFVADDAIMFKDWVTYRIWRSGGWDPAKAWFKGEGFAYNIARPGKQTFTENYVLLNDLAAGSGPVDPATDTTNFARCEEPEWQMVQRCRSATTGSGNGGTTGVGVTTEDNIEVGQAGILIKYLTVAFYEFQIIELERTPGNMVVNAQLEMINPAQDTPLFWYRSPSAPATISTLTATRTSGNKVLTGVTGLSGTAPVPDAMGLGGTGIREGAKVVEYDPVAGTILMNVTASASGTSTVSVTNLMDWTEVVGPGHQNAAGTKRRALRMRNWVPDSKFWSQLAYNARARGYSPSFQSRSYPTPVSTFPRSSEFIFWTKADNLRATTGTTLVSAIDIYYNNREAALLMQYGAGSSVGPSDTYFYPLGPPAAHATCTRTAGSDVLTDVSDTSKLSIGRSVKGTGIRNAGSGFLNTWITEINPTAKTVRLNQTPTAPGTSVLDFGFSGGDERGDGTGTWDWYPTKFWHLWRGEGQPVFNARLQYGFHADVLVDSFVGLDLEVRPVGGHA